MASMCEVGAKRLGGEECRGSQVANAVGVVNQAKMGLVNKGGIVETVWPKP